MSMKDNPGERHYRPAFKFVVQSEIVQQQTIKSVRELRKLLIEMADQCVERENQIRRERKK